VDGTRGAELAAIPRAPNSSLTTQPVASSDPGSQPPEKNRCSAIGVETRDPQLIFLDPEILQERWHHLLEGGQAPLDDTPRYKTAAILHGYSVPGHGEQSLPCPHLSFFFRNKPSRYPTPLPCGQHRFPPCDTGRGSGRPSDAADTKFTFSDPISRIGLPCPGMIPGLSSGRQTTTPSPPSPVVS
jgi:hypothetical protein